MHFGVLMKKEKKEKEEKKKENQYKLKKAMAIAIGLNKTIRWDMCRPHFSKQFHCF